MKRGCTYGAATQQGLYLSEENQNSHQASSRGLRSGNWSFPERETNSSLIFRGFSARKQNVVRIEEVKESVYE